MMTFPTSLPIAEVVADLLVEAGVRRIYTVPGESFLPLLEAFESHKDLRLISTRHEGGAAFMAEADAKLTGKPAVVMATRGVGAANLSIGMHTAHQDSTPMLALIGHVETAHLGNEGFQELDLEHFLGHVSTWSTTVHRSDRVADTVARALVRATTGRPGPATVALPSDVLEGMTSPVGPMVRVRPSIASPADAERVTRLLAEARRPVIIAGQGTRHRSLVAVAQTFGAGVYTAFRRQDYFPNDDGHYLGHLTLGTPPQILAALDDADVVLVLGERLDEVTTQTYTRPTLSTQVVHIHPDPAVFGVHQQAEIAIAADPAEFCEQLLTSARNEDQNAQDDWWRDGHTAYLEIAEASAAPAPSGALHPGRAIAAVQSVASPDTIVTNDAGNFSIYLHRQWKFQHERTQAAPISGAMGYAVPAAIGASLAFPDRSVLGVAGDGGFLMTAMELETAVREGTQVKILVLQNGLYGTIAMHQRATGRRISACDIADVDLAGLARSLGAHAITCADEESLPTAAQDLMFHDGPAVLVVKTDPDAIAPGRSFSTMGDGQ
ncbi:thiamine pyrophosphate-dependent enzyme [Nesterenkonia sp. Act20]|uniref:thiamine pyrophosphate-dependent enzyme n=1 Tax=Nesterenkonia sp. Act20 TaxID=1483432 RepID=UPI001C47DDAB|nr:thiamine pyrophosphate-dependent enzyme [Nesterenkonia sp. Act20]